MVTSYNNDLPSPTEINKTLNRDSTATNFTAEPDTTTLLWEDGGGNEIRLISNKQITLLLFYDNESDQNFYPDYPKKQTALLEAPEEVTDLIEELKPELLWTWDDTDEIWYTAAFWSVNNKTWETSYDWEENHDEDSISWMLETLNSDIIK